MEKQKRRQYSPRGERRKYTTLRIDIESRDKLKMLAEKMEVPIVEAIKIAVDDLEEKQAKELD
jgi:hypothetical protein